MANDFEWLCGLQALADVRIRLPMVQELVHASGGGIPLTRNNLAMQSFSFAVANHRHGLPAYGEGVVSPAR